MNLIKALRISPSANQYIIAYFLFVIMFFGLNYTADWLGYVHFLQTPNLCPDLLFRFIAKIAHGRVDFSLIYKVHILLMGILYLILIRRTVDCPALVVVYAIDIYIFMANQIRFYLAWPLVLLSLYSFYKKEFFSFIMLAFVAILSHKTVLLLIPTVILCDFLIVRLRFEKSLFILLFFSLLLGFIVFFDFGYGFGFNQLKLYQKAAMEVTFVGAVYGLIPYLVCLALIISLHRRILKRNPHVLEDKLYRFLLVLSVSPVVFLGIAFYMFVFSQRFAQSMILIWFIYFYLCYCKYSNREQKQGIVLAAGVIFFINPFFACFYALYRDYYYYGIELLRMLHSYTLLL